MRVIRRVTQAVIKHIASPVKVRRIATNRPLVRQKSPVVALVKPIARPQLRAIVTKPKHTVIAKVRSQTPPKINKAPPKTNVHINSPVRPVKRPYVTTQQKMTNIREAARQRGQAIQRPRLAGVGSTQVKIAELKNTGVGRVLVMIAAGPSVNEVNFTKIKDHPLIDFMCINHPCTQVWPAKYWAFCDHTQYRRNTGVWDTFKGTIINSLNVRVRKPNQIVISSRHGKGWSMDVTQGYHIGRSSTYANMQVANFMNFRRIYIFGLDMGASSTGQLHYYGQNHDVNNEIRVQRFAAEADNYMWAAQNLIKEVRDKFVICSSYNKWPFVEHFSRLDHLVAVDEILEYANEMSKYVK